MSEAIPLPPADYRAYVSGTSDAAIFQEIGRRAVAAFWSHSIKIEGARFLDIGCGCGRIARHLVPLGLRSYEGFDRHPGMIDWCQRHITPIAPSFHFRHVPVRSAYGDWDGHAGEIDAEALAFPYEDSFFDSISLTSVFTHMPLPEIASYAHEVRRVMAPQGRALATVFLETASGLDQKLHFGYRREEFDQVFAAADLRTVAMVPGDHQSLYILAHPASPTP
jgi:ubiquinone/menaquinone biosynthesis C-methylase UbiE